MLIIIIKHEYTIKRPSTLVIIYVALNALNYFSLKSAVSNNSVSIYILLFLSTLLNSFENKNQETEFECIYSSLK